MSILSPDAFARLVRRHLPDIARLAVRLCGDLHEAEDLVGDALLRATRHRERFRGDSSFRTWLYAILVNAFRDRLRTRERDAQASEANYDMADDRPLPVDAVATVEFEQRIAACVSALPPRQREALVLTLYQGLSSEEAARILETTPQNVRVLAHHARLRLREQLRTLVEPAA